MQAPGSSPQVLCCVCVRVQAKAHVSLGPVCCSFRSSLPPLAGCLTGSVWRVVCEPHVLHACKGCLFCFLTLCWCCCCARSMPACQHTGTVLLQGVLVCVRVTLA